MQPRPWPSPNNPFLGLSLATYVPPPDDLAALRRQQAAFAQTQRALDLQNSWMAAPVAAPGLAVLGLEATAPLLGLGARAAVNQTPLNLLAREAWQPRPPSNQPWSGLDADKLRDLARKRFEQAYGVRASAMGADAHHSTPLQASKIFPDADPNRLANLWPIAPEAHQIANAQWRTFFRNLPLPTQAEAMAAKLRIDRLVEPYLRTPGRSTPPSPTRPTRIP